MKTSKTLSHLGGAVAAAALLTQAPNAIAANANNTPPPADLVTVEKDLEAKMTALAKVKDPNSAEAKSYQKDIQFDLNSLKKLIHLAEEELKKDPSNTLLLKQCDQYNTIANDLT